MKAPLPLDEDQRLARLRQYEVLDTPPEQAFDDVTVLAAHICQTPMALVSLVDEDRQWFKSKVGVNATETPREIAFCAHTILQKGEVLEVHDAQTDPRFLDNALVTSNPNIRFYAGAALIAHDGHALGTLCVLDLKPRTLTPEQLAALRTLSRHVVTQLEHRRLTRGMAYEIAERQLIETQLRQHYEELSQSKSLADQLVSRSQHARLALLSVLEDEKHASQNLRESEERFRQLAENINEVFWITDPGKQQILYISPAYEKIWGRSCAILPTTHQTWRDAIHPEDREHILQAVANKQARGDYDETYRIIRPDGEVRWIRDCAVPLRNAAGEVYRIVGTAADITGQRKLEEQFRQVQKMEAIGQLAGGVAHDFNNLLTVIQGNSALLLMNNDRLSNDSQDLVKQIVAATERAANLTRQLLTFSRKQVMKASLINLNELLENLTKMLRRIIGEDIRLQCHFAPDLPSLEADAGMLEQVIMNLVVNARDAMPEGGELILATCLDAQDEGYPQLHRPEPPGTFVCIRITDHGTGIPPEILPRIFEPFFTTKEVGKGTGLGLATTFGIIQQHRGWINVQSELGKGTTFRIFLPAAPTQTTAPKRELFEADATRGHETILLVEDDVAVRTLVRTIFERHGYRVLEARSGNAALAAWAEHGSRVDLLMTDMVMPDGLTGKALAEKLREQRPSLKVIYSSGYSPEIFGKDLTLPSHSSFIQKPYNPRRLLTDVRKFMDGPDLPER